MNALIVFSAVLACSQAQLLAAPYAANYAGYHGLGYGLPYGYAAPAAYAHAPLAAVAPEPAVPFTAPSSQFQAQDEFGNLNYGYSNINSAKQETGNTYGGVIGSYTYIDANGIPQRADYIADAAGFRVKATNLPVAPAVPVVAPLEAPVYTGVAPAPVQDTPEVQAAKAEFQAAFDEAASRAKRSADAIYPFAYNGLYANNFAYNGLYANNFAYGAYGYPYANNFAYGAYGYAAPAAYGYAAPIAAAVAPAATTYSAPALRDAVLTRVKLNPGHAESYRVD